MVRWPSVPFARGFGVGLDLRFGDPFGFEHVPGEGDVLASRPRRFLERWAPRLDYAFFSWQPMDRGLLEAERYFPVWDRLFASVPDFSAVGLHHTALNLGSVDPRRDRRRLFDFTNALIDRYELRWVNEDVGIWSIDGKPMPYPLPPILTEEGLDAAAAEVEAVNRALHAPLALEFPGFSEGTSFALGDLDAYDFFRRLLEATDAVATLDTGHLLSWRWMLGHRGEGLYGDLERLPLDRCFEIHLSGCQIIEDRFVDVHHGVLHEAQLELLSRLLPRCPNLRAVAYEDPKPDERGRPRDKAAPGLERLSSILDGWRLDARVA